METIEHLQRRISGLRDLHSIVRTMKALSAVSIRQYERAVESLRGYYHTIELGLHVVLTDLPLARMRDESHPNGRVSALVFGSDHGLCGRFNEEIAEFAAEHLRSPPDGEFPFLLAVGARVAARLEPLGYAVHDLFAVPSSADGIASTVQRTLLKIDEWRRERDARTLHLFFNRQVSGASYEPTAIRLLPIDMRRFAALRAKGWPGRTLPTYSMDRGRLLSALLRQYIFVSIFRACAESQASEHASRLSAMRSAESNLDEWLAEVTERYRRERQSVITSELLDVVSGFEAITAHKD
ncbi:alternate F1F0 ATPase, F1 subunit gamma [Methylocaldum marinum]|uniref:Alternate F1F0 ATPase, F1 subunit gamma n=1 Tax=Methylocaldum marinum TaxID=1432792 RepID=A0A250KMB3_9GAMM|nr:F0F1 ATP synthase subunit gamma [Methylocaldum marinum]BBA32696.1 alternate F1F0 ATPase, F1 subunit gamma [Methylocaldum marinum]